MSSAFKPASGMTFSISFAWSSWFPGEVAVMPFLMMFPSPSTVDIKPLPAPVTKSPAILPAFSSIDGSGCTVCGLWSENPEGTGGADGGASENPAGTGGGPAGMSVVPLLKGVGMAGSGIDYCCGAAYGLNPVDGSSHCFPSDTILEPFGPYLISTGCPPPGRVMACRITFLSCATGLSFVLVIAVL